MTSWSYSAIKGFITCPYRYHEEKVLQLHPFTGNKHTRYGHEVHEAGEFYLGPDKVELHPGYEKFRAAFDAVGAIPGERFCELKMALTNDKVPCAFDDDNRWVRGIADVVVLQDDMAYCIDWKGLSLGTPLPTPDGWTTMGDVAVGDTLFSSSGDPCTVTGKSEVKNIPCYKVTFDDTSSVVCDYEHLWALHTGDVVPVTSLTTGEGCSKILLTAPLATPDIELPIDPYVLGMWIADGKHTSGEISKPDTFIWEEVQRRGYPVNMSTGGSKSCPTRTAQGLSPQLKAAGLMGNKHIPAQYLRAGYQQRLDLLRGLMDGDGSANATRKQAIYCTTDPKLSGQVRELLCSLGQRPLINKTKAFGFGLHVTAYDVSFRPQNINPFSLPRKANIVSGAWGNGQSWYRAVKRVEEIASVPTQCIAVDSNDHTFLCTEHMIPTHNTGNDKYPDRDQLELMSLMLFAHYPKIKQVKAALVFLTRGTMVKATYQSTAKDELWKKWEERYAQLETCFETDKWPKKTSGLCKNWCPCLSCGYNGKN